MRRVWLGLVLLSAFAGGLPALAQSSVCDPPAEIEEAEINETGAARESSDLAADESVAGRLSRWVERLTGLTSTSDRIVGGRRVCQGDWPYLGAVRRAEGRSTGYFCGATAISGLHQKNWPVV